MQIYTKLNENRNLSLALGFFDGVHLGHQAVIKSAVDYAKKNNLKSAVVTFKDHPCCHFYGVNPKYILTRENRRKYIESLDVDYLYELNFDKILSTYDAGKYLELLSEYFSPASISTGFNHYFGVNKSGNAEFLRENQQRFGYKYFEVSPQSIDGKIISSTSIRTALSKGDIEDANAMLGRSFSITGEVIEGQKLGRQIGFRTANLIYPAELIDIPFGVYKTKVLLHTSEKDNVVEKYAITNFGIRPTVSNQKQPILETHILDFDKDIYGQALEIKFISMLRLEKKFDSINELKSQIIEDIRNLTKPPKLI